MPHATTDITIESSDEALVAAYLETRDKGLFEELYSRYSGKIYGRCVSLLQDETLSQDAAQDVFLKIITNLSKFSEKSRFSTWVYSITYNWCIDIIRKRKKMSNLHSPEQIEDLEVVEEVEDSFLLETEVSRLKVVLEKIPGDDKAILLMKYLEEMSIKEITDVIGKSESAVKMKIKRAKHRFQLTYKEYFKDI